MFTSRRWLAVFTLIMVLQATAVQAATYYVRMSGSDTSAGTAPETAWASLRAAAAKLNHGDSLIIGPGRYDGGVLIAERFGSPPQRMLIVGDESGELTGDPGGPVVIVASEAIRPALELSRCRNVSVRGLTFEGQGLGLQVINSQEIWVQTCTFRQMTKGLSVQGANQLNVVMNLFDRCTLALVVQQTVNAALVHNTIVRSSAAGILLLNNGMGIVRNSVLTSNATNLVADEVSAAQWTSDYNVLCGASGPWGHVPTIRNPFEWSSATGQDRASVHVSPPFVDPDAGDFRIDPNVAWTGGLPGSHVGMQLNATHDRDGQPLSGDGRAGAGAYRYPQPAATGTWRKLDFDLPNAAGRQSAAIYSTDGTLIRTLLADAAGVTSLWWDGRDDQGMLAPASRYLIRSVQHHLQLLDDGAIGDNGNPRSAYNGDNIDRVIALPDGRFYVSSPYDEAGVTLRLHAADGQGLFGVALADGPFVAIAPHGNDVLAVIGKGAAARLIRLVPPGDRAPMASGATEYPILHAEEAAAEGVNPTPAGLAVIASHAYVSLPWLNALRRIDLASGAVAGEFTIDGIGDVTADAAGRLWAIAGSEVVRIDPASGQVQARFSAQVLAPAYLAVSGDRVAVVDRKHHRIALMGIDGQLIRQIGQDRTQAYWMPIGPDVLRDPRGCAFMPDGRLLLTEQGRLRALWPDTLTVDFSAVSNFMESPVTHPLDPSYVYAGLGVYHVDQATGRWEWIVETPPHMGSKEEDPFAHQRMGSPGQSVLLDGRPFVVHFYAGNLFMVDVSEPTQPRLALAVTADQKKPLDSWAYSTITFDAQGAILNPIGRTLQFRRIPFKGLDAQHNPVYDWEAIELVGVTKDPSPRAMQHISAVTFDRDAQDIYYLAVTERFNKMVPGWGADGTGVGRSTGLGQPLWFAHSSGGNYMAITHVNDGKETWIAAAKSFGGQLDLFDRYGLRLTTSNWSWPSHFAIGFVDLRYGVHGFRHPSGQVRFYVEDDAIGRFARLRLENADSLQRQEQVIEWTPSQAGADQSIPSADRAGGRHATSVVPIPRVGALTIDGDWSDWIQKQVQPQILSLPSAVGFRRSFPADLLQTFRAGTMTGALAHDGESLFAYFLVIDDTQQFNAQTPAALWTCDGIELWLEEEQVGLGFTSDGKPSLFKWRQHNVHGETWKANYALPSENIAGRRLASVTEHPLGRRLEAIVGRSLAGKAGYVFEARVPFEEIKLVGGIAGRAGTEILPLPTGAAASGQVVRVAVSVNNIEAWGRMQEFMIDWPVGRMFADPTRSQAMELE